jgi:hypothetical protein
MSIHPQTSTKSDIAFNMSVCADQRIDLVLGLACFLPEHLISS